MYVKFGNHLPSHLFLYFPQIQSDEELLNQMEPNLISWDVKKIQTIVNPDVNEQEICM